MTSSSCREDPADAASPALIADLALPAIPIVRKHALNASFISARIRLMSLISDGLLVAASIEAYAHALPKLARRIPADTLAASALIAVRISEPTDTTGMVVLPLRWHATGTGGQPVRVLNADLMLVAAGASRTMLRVQGAFRVPFVMTGPDTGRNRVAQRAAAASVNFLVGYIRQHLAGPAPGGAGA
jgi:hypothetical protein